MTQQQIAKVATQLQMMSIVPRWLGWTTHRCFGDRELKEPVDELKVLKEVDIENPLAISPNIDM